MAALENVHKLLQHSSEMQDLPAEEGLESRSNTSQANTLTIRPEALSSRGGLKFSTPTTTITSRCYQPPILDPNTRQGYFLSLLYTSTPAVLGKYLDVASLKCQWRSLVASTLHHSRVCLWQSDSDKLCSNLSPEPQLFALLLLYPKSALSDDAQSVRSRKD